MQFRPVVSAIFKKLVLRAVKPCYFFQHAISSSVLLRPASYFEIITCFRYQSLILYMKYSSRMIRIAVYILEKWFPLWGERAHSLKLFCMYDKRFEI